MSNSNQAMLMADIRERMKKCLFVLGGQKYRRTLSVRYSDAFPEELVSEILEAVVYETVAETTQELIAGARTHAGVFSTYRRSENADGLPIMLLRAANDLGGSLSDISIILSPMALTVLRLTGESFRPMEANEKVGDLDFVGLLVDQVRVYCDQYASDDKPAIVFAPGWFSYSSDQIVSHGADAVIPLFDEEKGLEDQAAEINHWIATDVMYKFNPEKYRLVGIDVQSL